MNAASAKKSLFNDVIAGMSDLLCVIPTMEDETSVPASSSSTGTTSENDSGASGPRAVASLPDKLKWWEK